MKFSKKEIVYTSVGVVLGSIGGYLYYKFVGCSTGNCAIASNPINMTLYGAFMGGLLLNMFVPSKKKN